MASRHVAIQPRRHAGVTGFVLSEDTREWGLVG